MTPTQGWIVITLLAVAVYFLINLWSAAVSAAHDIAAIRESLNRMDSDRDEIRNSLHAIETETLAMSRR